MSATRARYVTACQQLLALGVVVVALVPATRVVSLDVVGVQPGTNGVPGVQQPRVSLSAYEAKQLRREAHRHALRVRDRVEARRVSP